MCFTITFTQGEKTIFSLHSVMSMKCVISQRNVTSSNSDMKLCLSSLKHNRVIFYGRNLLIIPLGANSWRFHSDEPPFIQITQWWTECNWKSKRKRWKKRAAARQRRLGHVSPVLLKRACVCYTHTHTQMHLISTIFLNLTILSQQRNMLFVLDKYSNTIHA